MPAARRRSLARRTSELEKKGTFAPFSHINSNMCFLRDRSQKCVFAKNTFSKSICYAKQTHLNEQFRFY